MRDFIKQAFMDSGVPSSSRLLSAVCSFASIGWITHIVMHTHAMPDVATLGGVTAFSVAHYSANRLTQK